MGIEAILTGGISGMLVTFLLNSWLAVRLKAEIESDYARKMDEFRSNLKNDERIRDNRWDLKRQACLDALTLVDAVFSNFDWKQSGTPVRVVKQPVDTAKARDVMNRLALACNDGTVLLEFVSALGLHEPNAPAPNLTADRINALRNAVRKELGFGKEISLDPAMAFIARLGADPTA
jgi:hypothetical protein